MRKLMLALALPALAAGSIALSATANAGVQHPAQLSCSTDCALVQPSHGDDSAKYNATNMRMRLASFSSYSEVSLDFVTSNEVEIFLPNQGGDCIDWVSGDPVTIGSCGLSRSNWLVDSTSCSDGDILTNQYAKSQGVADELAGATVGADLYMASNGTCGADNTWSTTTPPAGPVTTATLTAALNIPDGSSEAAYSELSPGGANGQIGINSSGVLGNTGGSPFVFNYNSSDELVVASAQRFAGQCVYFDASGGNIWDVKGCDASAASDQWTFGSNNYSLMHNGYAYPRGDCPFDNGEGNDLGFGACDGNNSADRWHWH